MKKSTKYVCQVTFGNSRVKKPPLWVDSAFYCEDQIIIKFSPERVFCSRDLADVVSSILPETKGLPCRAYSVSWTCVEDFSTAPCQEVSQDV